MVADRLPRLQRDIPVTDADGVPTQWFQHWWQLLVDYVEGLAARILSIEGSTGWALYSHGGGAQTLTGGVRQQLLIDETPKIETQLPTDTGPLWADDAITGRSGDGIVVKVQCVFTPSSGTTSEVMFDVDVGGAVGIVEYHTEELRKGSGAPHYLSWTFAAYTLDTWEANGGKVYATANGPGAIADLRILIQRTHKARAV